MSAASNRKKLVKRAEAFSSARNFFSEKGVIEVDPCLLSRSASVDAEIDLFVGVSSHHGKRFLFSSPEYPMKRLLADGSGDIFFLGHVFRDEPHGQKHSPEFLLAEWYRVGFSFQQMMNETIDFVELFIGKRERIFLQYREALLRYASIDPLSTTREDLVTYCQKNPVFASYPLKVSSKDDLLHLIVSLCVEPSFPKEAIVALYNYPPSQAALARHKTVEGKTVAERFELYAEGMELANGYHELADEQEQRKRLLESNELRKSYGKEMYPIDEPFLTALSTLPDCCGVAVGVDRLIMIQEKALFIDTILPIPWDDA